MEAVIFWSCNFHSVLFLLRFLPHFGCGLSPFLAVLKKKLIPSSVTPVFYPCLDCHWAHHSIIFPNSPRISTFHNGFSAISFAVISQLYLAKYLQLVRQPNWSLQASSCQKVCYHFIISNSTKGAPAQVVDLPHCYSKGPLTRTAQMRSKKKPTNHTQHQHGEL